MGKKHKRSKRPHAPKSDEIAQTCKLEVIDNNDSPTSNFQLSSNTDEIAQTCKLEVIDNGGPTSNSQLSSNTDEIAQTCKLEVIDNGGPTSNSQLSSNTDEIAQTCKLGKIDNGGPTSNLQLPSNSNEIAPTCKLGIIENVGPTTEDQVISCEEAPTNENLSQVLEIKDQKPVEKINLNSVSKLRTTFFSNLCHICKEVKAEIICPKCNLIRYCSIEHRKAHWPSHSDICQAVQQLKLGQKVDHIFSKATGLSPEDFRNFRYNLLVECQNLVERQLEPWERELFLYPAVCNICNSPKTQLLDMCNKCSMVVFCPQHNSDKPSHEEWCSVLQLFRDFTVYEWEKGLLKIMFPVELSGSFTGLPETIDDFLDNYDIKSIYERTQLTQIITAPLTVMYGAQSLPSPPLESRKSFVVHLVGAEIEFELEPVQKWELFFQHLLPELKTLKLVLVGPELYESQAPRVEICSECVKCNKTLEIIYESGLLYHEYIETDNYIQPDIICIFNPGLSRLTGYDEQDSWSQTISVMFQENIPVVMTAYTEFEIVSDLKRVQETVSVNILKKPHNNPFSSHRPHRNFVSDDCVPVIFKNYYVCVLTAKIEISLLP